MKGGYSQIRATSIDQEYNVWRMIWRVKVPQRYLLFLWIVFNGRIMTNEVRYFFDFTSDSYCFHCNLAKESCQHLLRDYQMTRDIWATILPQSMKNSFLIMPFHGYPILLQLFMMVWRRVGIDDSWLFYGGYGSGAMTLFLMI